MKKHTFFDSGIFRFLSRIADLIILNILFLLCCLPIVTIGAALTAMFYVTLRMARNEESYITKNFFHSFRQNLKQGIITHLIFSVVSIIIGFDVYVLWKFMDISWIFKYLLILLLLICVLHFITFIYLYPVLAQFNNTIRNTIKNARFMALKHFPYTLAMSLISIFPVFCIWYIKYFLEWGILIFALFGFALIAYLNALFLVKIFDKYINEQTTQHL